MNYRQEYYQEHKQKELQRVLEYRLTHKKQISESKKKYRKAHREELARKQRERRQKYKDAYRDREYIRKYGITLEQKRQMFLEQEGRCLGCNKEVSSVHKIHVDHDHKTGKVRGLLCTQCNSILGYARDNILVLQTLIEYLQSFLLDK